MTFEDFEDVYEEAKKYVGISTAQQLIVGFPDDEARAFARVEEEFARHGLKVTAYTKGFIGRNRADLFALSDPPPPDLLGPLVRAGTLGFTEQNAILHRSAVPNDPGYGEQWALRKIGIEAAWDRARIAAAAKAPTPIRVAVIDSGVARMHSDLLPILAGSGDDADGHGTSLAGTIVADSDNNRGVASAIWPVEASVSLIAVKFFDVVVPLSSYFGAIAITLGVLAGARIINLSWDVGMTSSGLRNALLFAELAHVLVVVAAGNDGTDNVMLPTYPASYALPNMLSVLATNRGDEKAWFSNYGGTVDLGAPGVGLLSTHFFLLDAGTLRFYSGTSAACALVTSAAALLWALEPGLSETDLKEHLMNSATDPLPGPFTSLKCGASGRLDLQRALEGPLHITQPFADTIWAPGTNQTVRWTRDYSTPACNFVTLRLSTDGGTTYPTNLGNAAAAALQCPVVMPNVVSTDARVRVESNQAAFIFAESGVFAIQ